MTGPQFWTKKIKKKKEEITVFLHWRRNKQNISEKDCPQHLHDADKADISGFLMCPGPFQGPVPDFVFKMFYSFS